MSKQSLTVQAVAKLSGVTVRTLHHYDEIGLLCPTRGKGGYRHYSPQDVLRLQQILVYRALGLPLQRIKALMDDPSFNAEAALVEQRAQLQARAEETVRMLGAVDRALARLRGDPTPTLAELFDGFDPAAYAQEAEDRWGHTDAYAESQRRTSAYSEEDWIRIKAEADAVLRRVAEAVRAGTSPGSSEGAALADAYRLHIDRYYYPCSPAMYREIAAMYTQDPRFQANLDRHGDGVAAFLTAAAAS